MPLKIENPAEFNIVRIVICVCVSMHSFVFLFIESDNDVDREHEEERKKNFHDESLTMMIIIDLFFLSLLVIEMEHIIHLQIHIQLPGVPIRKYLRYVRN